MKKKFLILVLLIVSNLTFAKDPLAGKVFTTCDGGKLSSQYWVGFFKGGEEFEAILFFDSPKKDCDGHELFAIGRNWDYSATEQEFESKLVSSKVVILSQKMIKMFNDNKFCEKSNWKLNEVVTCTGMDVFGLEERTGFRTSHSYKLDSKGIEVKGSDGEVINLNLTKE